MPREGARTTGETQAMRTLRVLYLFAGRKRKADMKCYLEKHGKAKNIKVKTVEVDILRGRHQDLTCKKRKGYLMRKIEKGDFDVVIASPPCGTFSRA